MKKSIRIAGLIMSVLLCYFVASNSVAENIQKRNTQVKTVSTYEELKKALEEETDDRRLVELSADIDCDNNTINISTESVEIDFLGYTIYTRDEKAPLFRIGETPVKEIKLTKDLRVNPLEFPESFVAYIEDTSELKEGERIYISDENSGEFNSIKSIIDEKSILLSERPNTIYSKDTGGGIAILHEESPSVTFKNGTIINENTKTDIKPGTEQDIILEKENENAVITASYCENLTISNIEIENANYNQSSITAAKSEGVGISGCRINGGRAGVILSNGTRNSKVVNNEFYDCSGGIILTGDNNTICNNTIMQSGNTLNFGDGMTIMDGADYNTISNNVIIGGNCYGIWGLEGKQKGNSIIGNTIASNVTYGLYLYSGSAWIIKGNTFEHNSGGICVEGISNSVISENSITNNLISGIAVGEGAHDCNLVDNILNGNNYIDPNEAGYGGDIVLWNNPKNIVLRDNIEEQEVRYIN